jgi:Glycosyltransferase family 87
MLMLLPVALAAIALYANARGHSYGFDFRGGMWKAGRALLAGRSPYPPPDVQLLLRERNLFIPPPLLALIAVPFAALPWTLAIILWNLVCVAALAAALYLVGVRDWRLYPLAVCSYPFVSSIGFGQSEALLALGLAAAWRWRGSIGGAVAVGALIAAKLLLWPLAIWLLLTRGVRAAGIALAAAAALLAGSWACIGFKGLAAYPSLLAADARAFDDRTHSVTSGLMRLGASVAVAQVLAIVIAGAVSGAIVRRYRPGDRGYFAAAIAFSLLASTLMEMHYLTVLLVLLAIARPRLDALWLFAINVFWLSPLEPPRTLWQIALVVASTTLILSCAFKRSPVEAPHAARFQYVRNRVPALRRPAEPGLTPTCGDAPVEASRPLRP